MAHTVLDFTILPALTKRLREASPDIVVCHLFRASIYGRVAAALAGQIPVLCVAHNIERYMTGNTISDHLARFLERLTNNLVAAHVAVSNSVAYALRTVMHVPAHKIHVIRNGLPALQRPDSSLNSMGVPDGATASFNIVSVARLHPQKRLNDLIKAVRQLVDDGVELRCFIAGEGESEGELRSLIEALNLGTEVTLLGRIADVTQLLIAADVFVLPSEYEGLPIALLEAMRLGVTAVVSDAGGMPEAVVHETTGFIFPIGDVAALVSILRRLASAPAERARLGAAATQHFEQNFTADRMAHAYMRLINDVNTVRSCNAAR